ncbi:MAG: cob(I)yrinic acid a,c-diamide adenosyltransferase [Candidatus Hydrogenedentota bacterium]|nr:MAG: cob(I)yrinic acid a,c-diamide adenosyltransferase [Candidatus Hydrogenedentota bacterium]
MRIYTKTGDKGTTSLFGKGNVSKNHLRVQTYGSIDEANSAIGMYVTAFKDLLETQTKENDVKSHYNLLMEIQQRLFDIGAELATVGEKNLEKLRYRVQTKDVEKLEQEIDRLEKILPPLTNFILPGGCMASSYAQFARSVVRRSERDFFLALEQENLREEIGVYLNRLSDFLFVSARYANFLTDTPEIEWK